MNHRGLLSAAVIFFLAGTVHAAIVQKEAYDEGIVTISKGLVKKNFTSGEMAVFDSKLGLVTAVFPASQTYTTFSKAQFCNAVAEEDKGYQVREAGPFSVLDVLPGGFHVDVAEGYQVQESDARPRVVVMSLPTDPVIQGPPKIKVVEAGAGGVVAGFKTTRYKVYVNGELDEEVWMATDPRLLEEVGSLNMKTILGFFQCDESVTGPSGGEGVAGDDAYQKLFETGWPLKIKSGGDDAYYKVVSVVFRDVPAAEFGVPNRYQAVPFSRSILGIDDSED